MRNKLVRLAVSAICLLPAACATTSYTRTGVAALADVVYTAPA